jgi:hypothetical protein
VARCGCGCGHGGGGVVEASLSLQLLQARILLWAPLTLHGCRPGARGGGGKKRGGGGGVCRVWFDAVKVFKANRQKVWGGGGG